MRLSRVASLLMACAVVGLTGCGSDPRAVDLVEAHDWQLTELRLPASYDADLGSAPIDFHWQADTLYVGGCAVTGVHTHDRTLNFYGIVVDSVALPCAEIPDQSTRIYVDLQILHGKAHWAVVGSTLTISHGSKGELVLHAVARKSIDGELLTAE